MTWLMMLEMSKVVWAWLIDMEFSARDIFMQYLDFDYGLLVQYVEGYRHAKFAMRDSINCDPAMRRKNPTRSYFCY